MNVEKLEDVAPAALRDALRRMEEEDERALRLARPSALDVLTDLTEDQLDAVRRRVRAGIANIEAGKFAEYEGREGLSRLVDKVKVRGRKLLANQASSK